MPAHNISADLSRGCMTSLMLVLATAEHGFGSLSESTAGNTILHLHIAEQFSSLYLS